MRPEDSASVAALAGQLGYPCAPAEIETRHGRIAAAGDAAVIVARSPDDRVLGWVHVAESTDLLVDRHAEVRGLVVDAAARGQGVGRALLQAAERWAAGRGCRAMRVRSNTTRVDARGFYERAGYRVTKTQNHFHKALPGEGSSRGRMPAPGQHTP
jgi:GNAT superfamily N-acetyltransferase